MDYTVQEHGGRRVLPVPAGLRELASDLSREVLRAQPKNLFGFAADYLAAMLRARSSAVAAAEAVGYMLENDVTFGALLEARGVDLEEATRACIVIQAAFRGFCTRRDFRESGGLAMCDPIRRRYGVGRDVAERAVARIQAAFRGYMVRKILRHQQTGPSAWLADDFPRSKIIQYLMRTVPLDVANMAATKIQAVFRGYSVRQALQESIYDEVRKEIWTKKAGSLVTADKGPKDYSMVAAEDILAYSGDEGEEAQAGQPEPPTDVPIEEEEEEEEEEEDVEEEDAWVSEIEGRPSALPADTFQEDVEEGDEEGRVAVDRKPPASSRRATNEEGGETTDKSAAGETMEEIVQDAMEEAGGEAQGDSGG